MKTFKKFITDGFSNVLNGLGVKGVDPRQNLEYKMGNILIDQTLHEIYASNGIGMKAVRIRTQDMLREGFKILNDDNNTIYNKYKSLGLTKVLDRALTYEDVYGGSLLVFIINDGVSDLSQPLKRNKISSIDYVTKYPRTAVSVKDRYTSNTLNEAKNTRDYLSKLGKARVYNITTRDGNFDVHESRTYAFRGIEVPEQANYVAMYDPRDFGLSMFQRVWEELQAYSTTQQGINHINDNFITGVLTIKELGELLEGEDGLTNFKKRLEALDLSKHILNTMVVDSEGESYEKKASSVSGLSDLVVQVLLMLSAVVDMPYTLLMGQSPSGLNATGESDIRLWYDRISYVQEIRLLPFLYYFIDLCKSSSEFSDSDISNADIEFNPLWQPSDKEKAETRDLNSKADERNANIGYIGVDELRANNRGGYDMDPNYDPPSDVDQQTNEEND